MYMYVLVHIFRIGVDGYFLVNLEILICFPVGKGPFIGKISGRIMALTSNFSNNFVFDFRYWNDMCISFCVFQGLFSHVDDCLSENVTFRVDIR